MQGHHVAAQVIQERGCQQMTHTRSRREFAPGSVATRHLFPYRIRTCFRREQTCIAPVSVLLQSLTVYGFRSPYYLPRDYC